MKETIQLGELVVEVTRKAVKHVHLSVHPPDGRVTLVAPPEERLEVARAYVASRLGWIRSHQDKLRAQQRETPREFIERESHDLWGRRYLLSVREEDSKPTVLVSHSVITLVVRPGSTSASREAVFGEWQRAQLREVVPPLISKWEAKFGVKAERFFIQRMKTKWGACNHEARTIRLNTELVRKPRDLLEYVIAHELAHLVEANHGPRFVKLLDDHLPSWREARAELNALPLASENWRE
jgi:predicted metal-dependent hydrolase